MNEPGEIVGMVDVLKLTYATLEQINTMSTNDAEGPAWGKFWLSLDNDSESMVSGEGSHRPHTPGHRSMATPDPQRPGVDRVDSVQPHDSASHHGADSRSPSPEPLSASIEETPFPFKFKAPSGRIHRLHIVAAAGIEDLVNNVTAKLGSEVEAVGGQAVVENGKLTATGFALSYLDNEGDTVSITTDGDLFDAIAIARQNHQDKVDLFVHDPDKPPMPATLNPQPPVTQPLTPPLSQVKSRRRHLTEEDDEDDMMTPVKKDRRPATQPQQAEQIIAGVPNEILLPGAIAGLAIVIIGVFAISRASRS